MRIHPYGVGAVLVEPDDADAVLDVVGALRLDPDVVELVPATRTVLVVATPGRLAAVRARVAGLDLPAGGRPAASRESPLVTLEVVYDGVDLTAVAAEVGLDADGVVRAHASGDYVVAFCGFAPGFAYLTGLAPQLQVPRLVEPRTSVPAGSVGVAGEFTGVYPRASPGGWRLLGRTSAPLWDLTRDPPALLVPGTRVRFRPVR